MQDGVPQVIQKKSMNRGLSLPIGNDKVKKWLCNLYKREVERRKNEFIFTNELKLEISQIGDFLTTEERKYGLYLGGNVGNGKTTMLKAIRNIFVYLIEHEKLRYREGDKYPQFYKISDVATLMSEGGSKNEFREIVSTQYLFLDDVGEEPTEIKRYGTTIRPLYKIIDYRYENMLPTFLSSNLTASDIEKKYNDIRLTDRMYEMFKVIGFKGGSFR